MTYPQSNAITGDVVHLLQSFPPNANTCASIYLDTTQDESKSVLHEEDHHQGMARTHKLKDGSVYFFLSHSVIGGQGRLFQFKYTGPLDNEHVKTTNPLTVAVLTQKLLLPEEHPSDICFLPDIDGRDAGYLFVTEEFSMHRLTVYYWQPGVNLRPLGYVNHHFNNVGATVAGGKISAHSGPNFVFIDRYNDDYFLGIANSNVQEVALFTANSGELFPTENPGGMNIAAFKRHTPDITFAFPVTGGPCQVKLIRNGRGLWWLLAFRGDPNDAENATDFVDVYPVTLAPVFRIFDLTYSQHIFFKSGDTSFASAGTHYVESSARLLISSSYRWAEDEGPGNSSYVSRVDETSSL